MIQSPDKLLMFGFQEISAEDQGLPRWWLPRAGGNLAVDVTPEGYLLRVFWPLVKGGALREEFIFHSIEMLLLRIRLILSLA